MSQSVIQWVGRYQELLIIILPPDSEAYEGAVAGDGYCFHVLFLGHAWRHCGKEDAGIEGSLV